MDIASKVKETKNKLVFNKLVKQNWGYSPNSYKLFHERLFFDRPISKEYKKIIGDSPDLRKRFPIEAGKEFTDFFENQDRGFQYFNSLYHSFVELHNIKYSNFNENKFSIGKNEVKLFKGIRNYYLNFVDQLYNLDTKKFEVTNLEQNQAFYLINQLLSNVFYVLNCDRNDAQFNKIKEYIIKKSGKECFVFESIITSRSNVKDGVVSFPLLGKPNNRYGDDSKWDKNFYINSLEDFKEFIDILLTASSEFIGKYKTPNNKKLELVISLNPIDWLLCSSSEKWASCLNLHSDYLFWGGLPGLIGDKNRALAYITDGKKKEFSFDNYGKKLTMEVDRFISRSWLLLARGKKSKTTFLDIVREYPSSIGLKELLKKNVNIPILEDNRGSGEKVIGRYYVEAIKFKIYGEYDEAFFGGYYDSCSVHVAKKNKAKYVAGDYMWYKFNGCGGTPNFVVKKISNETVENIIYISDRKFNSYYDNQNNYENKFDYLLDNEIEFCDILSCWSR